MASGLSSICVEGDVSPTNCEVCRASLTRKQILKRQLRVVGLKMMRTGCSRHIERLAHGVEMKTNDAWRQAHGRNAAFACQTSHGGFAHLQDFGKLFGS